MWSNFNFKVEKFRSFKNVVSLCFFFVISINNCPELYKDLTLLGSPTIPQSTFSITNGERDVIFLSSVDSIRKKRGKLVGLESVICSVSDPSDSESDVDDEEFGLFVFIFLTHFEIKKFDSHALHPPRSPTRDVYVEMVLLFPTSKLHNYYTRVQDQGPFIKKATIQAQRLTQ